MSIPILFCSDVHLCPEVPERNGRFFRWLESLSNVHLVIVGDLFHYWWDYSRVPSEYSQLLHPFTQLSKRSVKLSLLGGNHDFSLPKQILCDPLKLPSNLHIEHGDRADKSFGYRALRTALRSSVFSGLMSVLGPRLGFIFLKHLAGDSNRTIDTNQRLVIAQRRHGSQLLDKMDWVLQGHSHYLAHEQTSDGALIWLGDWVHHCSYAKWFDGRLQLCRWREGRPEQEVVVPMKELGPL